MTICEVDRQKISGFLGLLDHDVGPDPTTASSGKTGSLIPVLPSNPQPRHSQSTKIASASMLITAACCFQIKWRGPIGRTLAIAQRGALYLSKAEVPLDHPL